VKSFSVCASERIAQKVLHEIIKKQVKRCVSPPHSSFEPMLELSLRSRGERSNIDREHARATP
jgi:hypothetical protein